MELLPFKVTTSHSGYDGYIVIAPDIVTATMVVEKHERNLEEEVKNVRVLKAEQMTQELILTMVKVVADVKD